MTFRLTWAVCVCVPSVPVIVSCLVFIGVFDVVEMFRVDVVTTPATETGLAANELEVFLWRPARLSETLPVYPPDGVIVTV